MTFRLTIHRAECEDVVVCEIIVEAATNVMTFSISVAICILLCYLSRVVMILECRVKETVFKIFCLGITVADVVAVVEVIVCEDIEFLESVVKASANTCLEWEIFLKEFLAPLHWETAAKVDGCVESLTFIFLKNDIDDTSGTFCVVTH